MPLLKLELKLKRENAYILRLVCGFQKKKMDFFNAKQNSKTSLCKNQMQNDRVHDDQINNINRNDFDFLPFNNLQEKGVEMMLVAWVPCSYCRGP